MENSPAVEVKKLQGQLQVQAHEIEFLRSRQDHLRSLADAAIKERDDIKGQLEQYLKSNGGDLRAKNSALEAEVAQLKNELAALRGGGGDVASTGGLLGVGRRLDDRRVSNSSVDSRESRSSVQARVASMQRLREEKIRTETLISQAEAARATTPPKSRAKLNDLLGKLGQLNEGLDEKMRSASQPRSSSRSRSRDPQAPVSVQEYQTEKQKLQALQDSFRATSPRLSREERLRMEGLMHKLESAHQGLDNQRANRLSPGHQF